MRFSTCCHIILLQPLLLATLPGHTQQPRKDTLGQHRDTLLLHFAVDKHDIRPIDTAQAARLFHDSLFHAKNIDSIGITGYTDKTGTLAHNQWLSKQRATTAGEWLLEQMGEPDSARGSVTWRLISGGIAPTPERTDSANRRAEIVIYYHVAPAPAVVPGNPIPRLADTAIILRSDSSQPTAVISLPINFVVDTPIPTDATRLILPGYVERLRQYANRPMEIDGFCNSLTPLSGPKDPLFILSVNRAKFMYDYLIDAGFDPARLTYKGMGNASPVNPDPTTRAEMDANMRVEIKIF